MPTHVLTGADARSLGARRDELAATFGGDVARFDLSVDSGARLARAARSYSLFSPRRVLLAEPVSSLDVTHAEALSGADDETLIVLSGSGAPTSTRVRETLADATWESFAAPVPREVAPRIAAVIADLALTVEPAARELLVTAATGAWPRVLDALQELHAAGLAHVTADDVAPLLGSALTSTTPWIVVNHLEAGDLHAALRTARATEPLSVIAHLSRRMENTGRVVDCGARTLAQVRDQTGLTSAAAGAALTLARRLGPTGVARSWDLIAAADRDAKVTGAASAVCDVLLCKLAAVWGV